MEKPLKEMSVEELAVRKVRAEEDVARYAAELLARAELPLSATQDLFMETLAGRFRCGENVWTFESRHKQTAETLAAKGLVGWKSGIVEKTIIAWLTEKGKKMFLSEAYGPTAEVPKKA